MSIEHRAQRALQSIAREWPYHLDQQSPFVYQGSVADRGKWTVQFIAKKTWFSRIYKLNISYSFPDLTFPPFHLQWQSWKQSWKSLSSDELETVRLLNNLTELNAYLQKIDIEKLEVFKQTDKITVSLTPIPGCFVWTLIPPAHYFVKLKAEEIKVFQKIFIMLNHKFVSQQNILNNLVTS